MSGMTSKDGNIDTARLEKDLRSALDFDIKYKQSDNMKKRACKISADYDEFKAFVACAHLKTVSRLEISSLGASKKGWQKSACGDKASGALILSEECEVVRNFETSKLSQVMTHKKPTNPMELERDLRRLPTESEKSRYLHRVGLKRIMKLLKNDGNAELLESIILIILSGKKNCPTVQDENSVIDNVVENVVIADNKVATVAEIVSTESVDDSQFVEQEVLEWLEAFTTISTFKLMVRFFSKEVILDIVGTLQVSDVNSYRDAALKYNGGV